MAVDVGGLCSSAPDFKLLLSPLLLLLLFKNILLTFEVFKLNGLVSLLLLMISPKLKTFVGLFMKGLFDFLSPANEEDIETFELLKRPLFASFF
jgi:hypothetical protein